MLKKLIISIQWCAVVALLLFSIISCKSEDEKNSQASGKAVEMFDGLDKKSVDIYPQFTSCDEMEQNSDCFYKNMHQLIQEKLSVDTLHLAIKEKDSLVAAFTVTERGQIRFDSIAYCAQHLDRKFIDSTIQSKLTNLPQIDSALKQGIPVSSSYLVPIVVKPIGQ